MPPMQIIVFYLVNCPVNLDASKLTRYLVALTVSEPCQARIFRGEQWHETITVVLLDSTL